jgi:hypothetical protein
MNPCVLERIDCPTDQVIYYVLSVHSDLLISFRTQLHDEGVIRVVTDLPQVSRLGNVVDMVEIQ